MAQGTRQGSGRIPFPRSRTFGTAATTAQNRLSWLFNRESILRLLLSLVLATALWLYVTGKQDSTLTFDYSQSLPISTANVPNGLSVTNGLGAVRVRVRLDNRSILVTPNSFHVYVNLRHFRAGTYAHVPVAVVPDPGIHVTQVTPATVPVLIEQVQTIHVPVRWTLLSQPPAGYAVGAVRINPSTITVSGPQSVVSQISQATVFIDLSQARSSVEGSYRPALDNSQDQVVNGRPLVDPPQVQVVVPVHQLTSYKTLPVLVPIRGQPRKGYGVSAVAVQPPQVTVHGTPSRLSRITSIYTTPVWVSRRSAGSFTVKRGLAAPPEVLASPQRVSVTTQVAPVSASSSVEIGVVPNGVAPGLVVHTRPASVLVTLVGPSSALPSAGRKMRAVLNLAGYGIGTFYLTPGVVAPKGVQLAGTYPATVTVTIGTR